MTSLFPDIERGQMCPSKSRAVDAATCGLQESGGASGQPALPAGDLTRSEKQKITEMPKPIADKRDAASSASNADSGALFINSPLQSLRLIRQRCFVTYSCFVPFAAPCYE